MSTPKPSTGKATGSKGAAKRQPTVEREYRRALRDLHKLLAKNEKEAVKKVAAITRTAERVASTVKREYAKAYRELEGLVRKLNRGGAVPATKKPVAKKEAASKTAKKKPKAKRSVR